MKHIFLALLFFKVFVAFPAHPQDSLENVLKASKGTERVAILLALAEANLENDRKKSIQYAHQALDFSRKMRYKLGQLKAFNVLGTSYEASSDYKAALQYFTAVLNLARQTGDTLSVGDALYSIGQVYNTQVDPQHALVFFFQALRIKEKQQDSIGIARIVNAIGTVYDDLEKSDIALGYYQKALKISKAIHFLGGIAAAHNNMGMVYTVRGEYDKALQYHLESLRMSEESKDRLGVSNSYNNIGDIYLYQINYPKAISYYQKSLAIDLQRQDSVGIAINYNSIAASYFHLKNYRLALEYYKKAVFIAKKLSINLTLKDAYLGLSNTYEALNNYQQAHYFHKLYTDVKDAMLNEQSATHIAEMEARYRTEAKEKEIVLLKRDREIQEIKENRQEIALYFLMSTLAMLIIVALLVYSRYLIKKRVNQQLETQNQRINFQNQSLHDINSKLVNSETNLRALNATKDRFFSIISHDLRAPLNTMTGFLQVLLTHGGSFTKEELKGFALKMDKSVKNLVDMLENLLHWSRSQTGNIEFRPQATELAKCIQHTVDVFGETADSKRISIQLDIDSQIQVYADHNMLSLIIRNMLFNAIKFTREGGTILLTATYSTKEMLEVSVADTGIGISPKDIDKLFRVDTYHTTRGTSNEQGTGLGLLLCDEFVKRHGGQIWVESEINKGTIFYFTLPIAQESCLSTPID